LIEHGITSPPTQYRLYGDGFNDITSVMFSDNSEARRRKSSPHRKYYPTLTHRNAEDPVNPICFYLTATQRLPERMEVLANHKTVNQVSIITPWRPTLRYGYSYRASCAAIPG